MRLDLNLLIVAGIVFIGQCLYIVYDLTLLYLNYRTPLGIYGTGAVHQDLYSYDDGSYGTAPLKAGDTTLVNWVLVKELDCPGVSSRVWRGENGFYFVEPLQVTGIPMNPEPISYHISTKIPDLAPAGRLNLEVVGTYNCGDILGDREFTLGPVSMTIQE